MLYDRPYMRAETRQTRRLSTLSWLLIVLVAVYVMQNVVALFFGSRIYQAAVLDIFALSGNHVTGGRLWSLVTYGFLHDTRNILHILFNGLGIFFIGKMLTRMVGDRTFLELFMFSTFMGGVTYAMIHIQGSVPVLGASGALMGLITYFCMRRPEEEMTFLLWFIIPITLKPKWILLGLTGISLMGLLFRELPGGDNTAHSAHLGGIIGGVLYHWFQFRSFGFGVKKSTRHPFRDATITPPPPPKVRKVSYSVNLASREKMRAEVDRILDKINAQGFGSLTAEERKTLDEARDLMRK
jgi:membrane associated rhomboid family serine protease